MHEEVMQSQKGGELTSSETAAERVHSGTAVGTGRSSVQAFSTYIVIYSVFSTMETWFSTVSWY